MLAHAARCWNARSRSPGFRRRVAPWHPRRRRPRRKRHPAAGRNSSPASPRPRSRRRAPTINGVKAGQGPPVLLLHGAPQSLISWRLVAPELAKDHTVVVTDLRGYGDSSKPPDGENHANYSKRAMALDQVEVMQHFGFEKFAVIGHDRGGRVGHRMALDHPDSRHPSRRARHRADLLPLHARHARVRAGLFSLVQLSAAGARPGEPAQGGDRAAGGQR